MSATLVHSGGATAGTSSRESARRCPPGCSSETCFPRMGQARAADRPFVPWPILRSGYTEPCRRALLAPSTSIWALCSPAPWAYSYVNGFRRNDRGDRCPVGAPFDCARRSQARPHLGKSAGAETRRWSTSTGELTRILPRALAANETAAGSTLSAARGPENRLSREGHDEEAM